MRLQENGADRNHYVEVNQFTSSKDLINKMNVLRVLTHCVQMLDVFL